MVYLRPNLDQNKTTHPINTPVIYTSMKYTNTTKPFSKAQNVNVKDDLNEALEKISSVRTKIEDKELNTWLAIAEDQIVDTLNEIEEREDKVVGLIKSIAS